jgi:hypothetical protein
MERHELLERLAPLIPPPRAHQVRYQVLAPCASGRDRVVPAADEAAASGGTPAGCERRAGALVPRGGARTAKQPDARGRPGSRYAEPEKRVRLVLNPPRHALAEVLDLCEPFPDPVPTGMGSGHHTIVHVRLLPQCPGRFSGSPGPRAGPGRPQTDRASS